ncbi:MFS transporter [Oerskovia turbata]|uniref:MFS transporter n=1 Tax=Oerskovia turbata TaxID=1713 RepID=A0A4Q1L2K5_9CELL|nr:MFS transporter [Oerskovia turbata]RXR28007.1 MFS transporter [Oerskovia turbata]RXR35984.1 MFS transporter [Oerskovia turbata]TGJ94896.1 MFS transporter [Actinotalea fermentans ATCC 43279 = JCM 9966 = DSM 3133]
MSADTDTAAPVKRALRTRPFRLLTVAWGFTNFADSVLAVIFAVWVKDLTGSNGTAGLVFAALGLPALVSPLLGQVADRVSRRRMMIVAYLVGAVSLLSLFAVRGPDQVWLIFVVTVVYSGIGFATAAAQSGLIRDLLPDEALGAANGRLTTIDQTFRLVMPVIGAGVYVAVGPLPLVVSAVVAFVIAAFFVSRIVLVETPPTPQDEREPFLAEVTAGFRHLVRTAPLGVLTVALAVAFGAVGVLNAVSFAVIENGLGLGPEMLGPISSVQGVTAIVAGLTAARMIKRIGSQRLVALALGIVTLGILPALGTNLPAIIAGMGAIGLGVTWAIVGFVTERQLKTPSTLQGRTSAATNMLLNVPQLAMTVVAAAVVGAVDYRLLVGVTAAGLAVSMLLSLKGSRASAAEEAAEPAQAAGR